jgi:predicted nucleotidyltransferase
MVVKAMKQVQERAKAIITEEVEGAGCKVKRILLFGSRATENFRPDSDWDFYVIIDRDLGFHKQEGIACQIRFRLAKEDVFADVFVQSEEVVNQRKGDTGYLTYYVLKEGVPI